VWSTRELCPKLQPKIKLQSKRKNFDNRITRHLVMNILNSKKMSTLFWSDSNTRVRSRGAREEADKQHTMQATRGGDGFVNDDAHTCRLVQAGRADTSLPSGEVPAHLI
jgi:hypothetical protein